MKLQLNFLTTTALAWVMATLLATAQPSAFTYQGKLSDGGGPANGDYDMTFDLTDAASGGNTVGTVTVDPVTVTDGIFTVELDYGAAPAFIGSDRWLEISVRPSGSVDPYTDLAPAQPINSTPYANFAAGVNASGLVGQVTGANLPSTFSLPHTFSNSGNSFTGEGSGLTDLAANELTSGVMSDARLSSNVALRSGGNTFTGNQIVSGARVGIGTSSPTVALEVTGPGGIKCDDQIRAYGEFGALSFEQRDDSSVAWQWVADSDSTGARLRGFGNSAGDPITVLNNGNVGIGTTPGTDLSVGGILATVDPSDPTTYLTIRADSTSGNLFDFGFDGATRKDVSFKWQGDSLASSALVLDGPTRNVGIGTTSPSAELEVNGEIMAEQLNLNSSGFSNVASNITARAGDLGVLNLQNAEAEYLGGFLNELTPNNSNTVFALAGNAEKPGGGSWGFYSDRRLKKDIIPVEDSLDRLLELRSVTYRYKDPEKLHCDDIVYTGFIAQEAEEVFPEWVSDDKDGMKHMAITGFESLAVQALRELRAEKDEQIGGLIASQSLLETENSELKDRLALLEERIEGHAAQLEGLSAAAE